MCIRGKKGKKSSSLCSALNSIQCDSRLYLFDIDDIAKIYAQNQEVNA